MATSASTTRRTASIAAMAGGLLTVIVAAAPPASALSGFHDGFQYMANSTTLDAGVNYYGTRSVDVKAVVTDAPGDAYCTVVVAKLYGLGFNQLGNTITLGSVCNGQTAALPLRSISTQAGDIGFVSVVATRGSGGAAVADTCA